MQLSQAVLELAPDSHDSHLEALEVSFFIFVSYSDSCYILQKRVKELDEGVMAA